MASAMVKGQRPVGERSEAPGSATCAGSETRAVRLGGHLCALVARADRDGGRLLEKALEGGGFDVIPVEDGVTALEMICAVGPDLIVADLDGRDVDGLLLCRVLRSLSAHATLPVVVLTRAAAGDARARATAALANVSVLRKPAVPALVVAAASDMVKGVTMVGRRAPQPRRIASPIATERRAAFMGG